MLRYILKRLGNLLYERIRSEVLRKKNNYKEINCNIALATISIIILYIISKYYDIYLQGNRTGQKKIG